MQFSKHIKIIVLFIGLAFLGLQCSSTELTSAKLYIQQKNWDKALAELQSEVQKNPKSDEGLYYLGVVYGEKGMYDEMLDAFNKSLAVSDKFKKEILNTEKYHWANLFNEGVAYYQRETKVNDPDSSKLYYDKSVSAFQNAIKIEPDSADTYKNIAFVYTSKQDYDAAIDPLQKLIDKENSLDGYKFLGEIYYNKGQQLSGKYAESKDMQDSLKAQDYYNKTIELLEKGRKSYPDDSDLLLTLSNAYIAANKIDVAIDAFKTGVEKDPNNQYYRYNYGVLLLGKKDYQGAIEQFSKALDIDPNYQNALYNIAVSYVKWGSELIKKAEEDSTVVYKPQFQKALPYLEKLVQIKSDDAGAWELLGKVYTILGMKDDATNAFNKADELRK